VVRSKGEVYAGFGSKLILSKRFIEIVNGSTFGSKMPRVSWDFIANLRVAYPAVNEQTAIANYLDRKTAEIDALIAQKQRLIELYQEEKTAIINQAVTKGIGLEKGNHKRLPLRDSGIDWLGEIPVEWEVKKLKYLVSKVGSGVTPKGGASVYQLSGVPLLRSQNIHFDGLKMDDVAYISEETHDSMANSKVQAGDALLNITGASIGRCFYADEYLGEANVNQHVCIVRPKNEVTTKYLYFILRSNLGQEQIDVAQTGSGREGLNFEALNNFLIPHISLEEQDTIVRHIETETARIDAKIAKTQRIIDLQKEYRTALISEVVTGKIKVIHDETNTRRGAPCGRP
jgi:type I restriction enzyme S subunit